ncbi:MAG: hypothetical protein UEM14_12045 [Faecalibacterium prausnitzii]|jgi:hypothetical protein|nr:hypothetical protein [Faecalibacterium prausnitzii]
MADKRIQDFATLAEAADDDLILVSSSGETYNIKVSTLKAAVSAALKSTLDNLSTGKADKSTVNNLDQNFKNFVKDTNTALAGKASTDSVSTLNTTVEGLKKTKADASTVSALNGTVEGLKTSKADTSTVTKLQQSIDGLGLVIKDGKLCIKIKKEVS